MLGHRLGAPLVSLLVDKMSADCSPLQRRLAEWFVLNARALPWRETSDPYHIWLSEVILQQTQVVQGMGYYQRFVEAFPTVEALASASEDEVLRLWQGLGYYSRGRNLLRAAQMVMHEFEGELPRTLEQVKRLPGVGPYTQAAILSFAYNLPHAAVDGNVYRVLSRLFADATPIDTPQGQRHYRALATALLDQTEPGRHNQAMIELGALVCTPRNPRCEACPIDEHCLARRQGNPTSYPIKQGKTKVTNRYLNYIYVRLGDGITLIHRRGRGDIWQGLYEYPLIETPQEVSLDELIVTDQWQSLMAQLVAPSLRPIPLAERQHRLTHRLLHARLYIVEAEGVSLRADSPYQIVPEAEREAYAMPQLLVRLSEALGE